MADAFQFKPNKLAFVYYGIIKAVIISFFIFIILYIILSISFPAAALALLILYACYILYIVIAIPIQYRKEIYEISANKMKLEAGGILSNIKVELIQNKVTNISLTLPFFEHLFFQTGYIEVKSAGTSVTQIAFSAIDNPKQVYDYVIQSLRNNGFSLKQKKVVFQTTPHLVAVILDSGKTLFAALFFFLAFAPALLATVGLALIDFAKTNPGLAIPIAVICGILIVLGILLKVIFHMLDQVKRVYTIYDDAITYSEGFLSKHYALIPMENVADTHLNKTVIGRVLDFSHISISCQGSSQEIAFRNLQEGEELLKVIQSYIEQRPIKKETQTSSAYTAYAQQTQTTEPKKRNIPEYTAKMHIGRVLIPIVALCAVLIIVASFFTPIILLLMQGIVFVIAFAAAAFQLIIKALGTTYQLNAKTISEEYTMLRKQNTEFALTKITGVIFRESLIDRMFKTHSIKFWSIGSSRAIEFKYIRKDPALIKSIMDAFDFDQTNQIKELTPAFTFPNALIGNIFPIIILIAVVTTSIALAISYSLAWLSLWGILALIISTLLYAYSWLVYSRYTKMTFFKDHLTHQTGIIIMSTYYITYKNVRDTAMVAFPVVGCGNMTLDVAGEQITSDDRGRQTTISNTVTIPYIANIRATYEEANSIIERFSSNSKNSPPIMETKPSLANVSFMTALSIIAIFALVIFIATVLLSESSLQIYAIIGPAIILCIIFIVALLSVKMTAYSLFTNKVVEKSGIFFKRKNTISYRKIDFIKLARGAVNKMFSNGDILIQTTGSSAVEMKIRNVKDYESVYAKLKEQYEKAK